MKAPIIIAVASVLLFLVLLSSSLFAWIGPTYRYRPGHHYHGGFMYWGMPAYRMGTGPGHLGGRRGVGGSFRGGGPGFGK